MPSKGDVVYVPFHFTDQLKAKFRPAVVISTDEYHASRREVIIAGITSNLLRSLVGQAVIADWEACGLTKPSAVSGIIMTTRNDQLGPIVGFLSADDSATVEKALRQSLGL
jgi:mRNA interferase MazF